MVRGDSTPAIPAEMQRALGNLIADGDIEKAVATLAAALDARTSVRTGGGGYAMAEDWRSRIAAAKLLIEFKHGKATQTVKHSGAVGHIHATPDELIAQAAARIGNTERVVREYLPADATPAMRAAGGAEASESIPLDLG